MSHESVARPIIELLVQSLGLAGVAFIVAGALIAVLRHIESVLGRPGASSRSVRLTLGHYTLLGLEFLVAQDLVESVITTDFEHLLGLGGVVMIRTVLEHFLGKEVEHLSHQAHAAGEDPDPGMNSDGWWPRFRSGMAGALSQVGALSQIVRVAPPPLPKNGPQGVTSVHIETPVPSNHPANGTGQRPVPPNDRPSSMVSRVVSNL